MDYIAHILVLICIYLLLALPLTLLASQAGLLSMAQAALFGVGAYAAALSALELHAPFPVACVAAVVSAVTIAAALSIALLRLKGEYFVLGTFAVQVVASGVMTNWTPVTRGPMGLPGIPSPTMCGFPITTPLTFLAIVGPVAVMVAFSVRYIAMSPLGRVLTLARDDEVLAASLGKNITMARASVWLLGACVSGLAGAMYAFYVRFIDPTSFTVAESLFVISIVILASGHGIAGTVLATIVLVVLPESLRFLGVPDAWAANGRQILYGCIVVAFLLLQTGRIARPTDTSEKDP